MENYLEKNKKRSKTRFEKEVKKKNVLNFLRLRYDSHDFDGSFEDQNKWFEKKKEEAAYIHKNPANCSCEMCGNPRRKNWTNGLTLKELKFLDKNHPENRKNILDL